MNLFWLAELGDRGGAPVGALQYEAGAAIGSCPTEVPTQPAGVATRGLVLHLDAGDANGTELVRLAREAEVATLVRGRPVMREREILAEPGYGQEVVQHMPPAAPRHAETHLSHLCGASPAPTGQ